MESWCTMSEAMSKQRAANPISGTKFNFVFTISYKPYYCLYVFLGVQGWAKVQFQSSVNMRRKNYCVLMFAAGRRVQFYTSNSQNLELYVSPTMFS